MKSLYEIQRLRIARQYFLFLAIGEKITKRILCEHRAAHI